MSKIESILEVSKKIVSVNYTNLESMHIMKDEKTADYVSKLSDCFEKFNNEDKQFFNCAIKSVCPEETEGFVRCQKTNQKNLTVCIPILVTLQDCMKSYSNRTLEIIKKSKNY